MSAIQIAVITEGQKGVVVLYNTAIPIPNMAVPFGSDSILYNSVGRVRAQNPINNGIIIHFNDNGQDYEINLEDTAGVTKTVDFVYLDGSTITASNNTELSDNFNKILGLIP